MVCELILYRIQYAFARVIDPNVRSFSFCFFTVVKLRCLYDTQSKLAKFVQINWCGDGVPEVKKGLFHSHSGAVAKFLRGAHVVINARNEVRFSDPACHSLSSNIIIQSDVAPALIMKRVEAASGAKYSAHNEKARKFEPIAPVGTNYTPIGKPDIAAMRRVPPAPRPVFGAPVPAPMKTAPPRNAPDDDDWGDEPPARAPPPPAASRPPALPSAPRPAPTSVSIRR